jgi:hypothetical protein
MHTLGACLAGVYLGFVGYLGYKVKTQSVPFTIDLVAASVILLILLFLLDREDTAKKRVEGFVEPHSDDHGKYPAIPFLRVPVRRQRHIVLSVAHPSALFVLFAGFALYLSSPSPYITRGLPDPLGARLFLLGLLAASWLASKRNSPQDIRDGEFIFLLFSLTAALLLAIFYGGPNSSLDWPYLWSILLFMIANVVLLKNRQNVRDDLISLEFYTLKRYITDHDLSPISGSDEPVLQ